MRIPIKRRAASWWRDAIRYKSPSRRRTGWSHGYAYEYMRRWDAFWPDGELPIVKARKPCRIAIANSDSGAYAYAYPAIDQAARAVRGLWDDTDNLPAFVKFPVRRAI